MPKMIDYSARFEFLRLAAFEVVRDQGPESVSLRRLAAALGCPLGTVRRLLDADSSLPALAADAVVTRWRTNAMGRSSPGRDAPALDRATHLVASLLPARDSEVADHLVWFKLLGSRTSVVERASAVAAEPPLAVQFQVAERGWADQPVPAVERTVDDALEVRVGEHDLTEAEILTTALTLLGAPEDELPRLRALVHGLAWDLCLGHLTTEAAAAIIQDHLARVTT